MPEGAAYHFDPTDPPGNLGPQTGFDNINSLEMGGNVYETPGEVLRVNVTPLRYETRIGTPDVLSYAGTTNLPVTPSATTSIWLDDAGALQTSTGGFPQPNATPHLRLAQVVAGVSDISSIEDRRPKAVLLGVTTTVTPYSVAQLPGGQLAGTIAFATDGRKVGEGAGLGTGVLVYFDGSFWRRTSDDTTVAA